MPRSLTLELIRAVRAPGCGTGDDNLVLRARTSSPQVGGRPPPRGPPQARQAPAGGGRARRRLGRCRGRVCAGCAGCGDCRWTMERWRRSRSRLGADVPVCLPSRPARMRGIGERIEPMPGLAVLHLLLVNPRLPAGHRCRVPGTAPTSIGPRSAELPAVPDLPWLVGSRNVLELPARALLQVIGEVLTALRRGSPAVGWPGCRAAGLPVSVCSTSHRRRNQLRARSPKPTRSGG